MITRILNWMGLYTRKQVDTAYASGKYMAERQVYFIDNDKIQIPDSDWVLSNIEWRKMPETEKGTRENEKQ